MKTAKYALGGFGCGLIAEGFLQMIGLSLIVTAILLAIDVCGEKGAR